MKTLKEFECKWGSWDPKAVNSYDDKVSLEREKFFSGDNGYTEIDIKSIQALEKEESYTCEYGNHTIKRLS